MTGTTLLIKAIGHYFKCRRNFQSAGLDHSDCSAERSYVDLLLDQMIVSANLKSVPVFPEDPSTINVLLVDVQPWHAAPHRFNWCNGTQESWLSQVSFSSKLNVDAAP